MRVARDVSSASKWLIIVKHHPLWGELPLELVVHIYKCFTVAAEQCWCGKWQRVDLMIHCLWKKMCSKVCYDLYCGTYAERGGVAGFLSLNNREPPGSWFGFTKHSICSTCEQHHGSDWIQRRDAVYCLPCWDTFSKNGLVFMYLKSLQTSPRSTVVCSTQ